MSLWVERAAMRARAERLRRRTEELLESAQAGLEPCDLTLVLEREGGAVFITGRPDWSLDRLLQERGAEAGWRIRRRGGQVCIEGRWGADCCRLRSPAVCVNRGLPRAGNAPILPAGVG